MCASRNGGKGYSTEQKEWVYEGDSFYHSFAYLCELLDGVEWAKKRDNRIKVDGETFEVFDCRDCDEMAIEDAFCMDREYFVAVTGDEVWEVAGISLHEVLEVDENDDEERVVDESEWDDASEVVSYISSI